MSSHTKALPGTVPAQKATPSQGPERHRTRALGQGPEAQHRAWFQGQPSTGPGPRAQHLGQGPGRGGTPRGPGPGSDPGPGRERRYPARDLNRGNQMTYLEDSNPEGLTWRRALAFLGLFVLMMALEIFGLGFVP